LTVCECSPAASKLISVEGICISPDVGKSHLEREGTGDVRVFVNETDDVSSYEDVIILPGVQDPIAKEYKKKLAGDGGRPCGYTRLVEGNENHLLRRNRKEKKDKVPTRV